MTPADPELQRRWIAHASSVTVKRLRDEEALLRREKLLGQVALARSATRAQAVDRARAADRTARRVPKSQAGKSQGGSLGVGLAGADRCHFGRGIPPELVVGHPEPAAHDGSVVRRQHAADQRRSDDDGEWPIAGISPSGPPRTPWGRCRRGGPRPASSTAAPGSSGTVSCSCRRAGRWKGPRAASWVVCHRGYGVPPRDV